MSESRSIRFSSIKVSHIYAQLHRFLIMDPNQINFDEMMNNPDILLKACNDIFGNDTVTTQQQYYQQQPTSPYQQQTSQLQQQLQRSQIVDVY